MMVSCSVMSSISVSVEPALFLFILGRGLAGPTDHALLYRKICLSLYNISICDDLNNSSNKHFLSNVQKQTSQWQFYESLAYNIPAMLTIGLYGSWSDRFSRKIPLLMGPIGGFLTSIIYLLSSIFQDSSVGYLLLGKLIFGLSGGLSSFLMASYSYISVKTGAERRTLRISIIQAFQSFAHAVAQLSSGVLLDNTGFVLVYSLTLVMFLFVILYIVIWLNEISEKGNTQETAKVPLSDMRFWRKVTAILGYEHMKEAVMVTFKKRNGRIRMSLVLLMFAWFFLSVSSIHSLEFLYLRHPPLGWSQTLYGYYSGYSSFMESSANFFLLPFLKTKVKAKDQVLLIVGVISEMLGRAWRGVWRQTWMVFITPFISYCEMFSISCIRGMVTSMVGQDEYGKIFAVIAWLSDLGHLLSSYLYQDLLYPLTVDVYPGFSFFISAILALIPLAITIWLYRVLRLSAFDYQTYNEFYTANDATFDTGTTQGMENISPDTSSS